MSVPLLNNNLNIRKEDLTTQPLCAKCVPACCFNKTTQIVLAVLGALLVVAGVLAAFLLSGTLGSVSLTLLIPSLLGLVQLILSLVFSNKLCSPKGLRILIDRLEILLDQADDGVVNGSISLQGFRNILIQGDEGGPPTDGESS